MSNSQRGLISVNICELHGLISVNSSSHLSVSYESLQLAKVSIHVTKARIPRSFFVA